MNNSQTILDLQIIKMRQNMCRCMYQIGQELIDALANGLTGLNWSVLRLLEIKARYNSANKRGFMLALFIMAVSILCR